MKDAYYFPHDSNAHQDPKCQALLKDFGATGYGVYWTLIESLHDQTNGKLEKFPKLYLGLATRCGMELEPFTKLIEAMLHDYWLLKQDDTHIWSERVLRNLEDRQKKYQAKADAGRVGGIKSGITRSKTKQNEALLQKTKQSKVKESKVKESKDKSSCNDDFITFLKSNLAYKHIDVDAELAKMDAWLLARPRRKKTRKFVIGWLNRVEVPLEVDCEKPKHGWV